MPMVQKTKKARTGALWPNHTNMSTLRVCLVVLHFGDYISFRVVLVLHLGDRVPFCVIPCLSPLFPPAVIAGVSWTIAMTWTLLTGVVEDDLL
uniref:Uncharacterized protein n=1 Tax=Oryza brachyantha TaxID=4533 RepID=J3MC90_ORYBR